MALDPAHRIPDQLHDLPKDKDDVRAAEALVARGFPAVEAVLPELLNWMQDGNWPVARVLAPFVASAGALLAPHMQRILNGDDNSWKYFLLQHVVAKSTALTGALRPELIRLSRSATAGEAAEGLPALADALLAEAP